MFAYLYVYNKFDFLHDTGIIFTTVKNYLMNNYRDLQHRTILVLNQK